MLDVDITKLVAESNAQVVSTVLGKPVTRGQLSVIFDKVNPAKFGTGHHWKEAIDQIVILSREEREMLHEAVIFFTGSVPTFEDRGGVAPRLRRYRVRAAGYFATIGA